MIPGSLNYPRNLDIQRNLGNPETTESVPPRDISPEKFFPEKPFPEKFKCLGEEFLGEKFLFSEGLAGNLIEIIGLAGFPRFANKKSRIWGMLGKSFISRIPGSLRSPEIIHVFGVPRFANKNSRILGIF